MRIQWAIIAVGIIALISLAIYVPWYHSWEGPGIRGSYSEYDEKYQFLFWPPAPRQYKSTGLKSQVHVDLPRVALPMIGVLAATMFGTIMVRFVAFKKPK